MLTIVQKKNLISPTRSNLPVFFSLVLFVSLWVQHQTLLTTLRILFKLFSCHINSPAYLTFNYQISKSLHIRFTFSTVVLLSSADSFLSLKTVYFLIACIIGLLPFLFHLRLSCTVHKLSGQFLVPICLCVILIHFPIHWVFDDVFSYSVQFIIMANDVFIIIALPYGINFGILTKPFCNTNFKTTNNRTNCF